LCKSLLGDFSQQFAKWRPIGLQASPRQRQAQE
jgi:hypothetical protein